MRPRTCVGSWLTTTRGSAGIRKNLFECELARTGTFGRHAMANQDPAFYIHHSFTFVVMDMAMRSHNQAAAPYYGLDQLNQQAECPGNNLMDVSVFNNLVPYTTGQTVGDRHTWAHIVDQWSFDKRHYRWVAPGAPYSTSDAPEWMPDNTYAA